MEALKTWMLNTGLNPDILPYILGAIILIVILLVYISARKKSSDTASGSASQARVEAEQVPSAAIEPAAIEPAEIEPAEIEPAESTATEAPLAAELPAVEPLSVSEPEAPIQEAAQEPVQEAVQAPEQPLEPAALIAVETADVEGAEAVESPHSPLIAVEEVRPEEVVADAPEPEPVAEDVTEQPAEVPTAEVEEIPAAELDIEPEPVVSPQEVTEAPEVRKKRLFERIKSGLSRTKANLTAQLSDLFSGSSEIDDDLLEEIETLLLMSDVGVDATTEIIGRLTDRVERKQLKDPQALRDALKQELKALLGGVQQGLPAVDNKPLVILMVGVNGVGKTTTIGKLTKRFQMEGKSVMLAAGDTFRAAAVEQLQVWGERNKVPVIAQHTGADSASVIFDALQSAKAKGIDVLIADTAGRLQNKDNLMQELAKVVRVMQKLDPTAPHEVMLVLDAGTGQNAISQAREFKEAVGVTGITMTKLDGTAKGGIIFAVAKQFDLPIRFIGVGEQLDDLRPFDADEFVDALFD